MHIWSSQGRGHWHPLTSTIRFARPAEEGGPQIPAMPGLFGDNYRDEESGRSIRSTMLHELAHKDAARGTRFGMLLGAAAGRALTAWRAGQQIVLPSWLDRVCGAMLPFLEGTAMYAQLDLDVESSEPILPNAITIRVQEFALADRGGSWVKLLQHYRLEESYEVTGLGVEKRDGKLAHGVLRALFIESSDPTKGHYLTGYLWLKAAAATLVRVCPEIARPALLYPILTKLIFDHPMFIEIAASKDAPDVETIVSKIKETFQSPNLARLKALISLAERGSEPPFDYVDAHHLLRDGDVVVKGDEEEDQIRRTLTETEAEHTHQMRAAAQCHIEPYVKGVVVRYGWARDEDKAEDEDEEQESGLPIEIEAEDGVRTTHLIPDPSKAIYLFNKGLAPSRRIPDADMAENAGGLEHIMLAILNTSLEKKVPIEVGAYVRLDISGDFGFAFWLAKPVVQLPGVPIPWTPGGLTKATLAWTLPALTLSPSQAIEFEDAIPITSELKNSSDRSTNILIQALIADKELQMTFRQRRLQPLVSDQGLDQLNEWAAVPLFLRGTHRLGDFALDDLHAVFDMPGFAPGTVDIRNMIPVIRSNTP